MRPGVEVTSRALPPPRSAPTDTGVCFILGDTGSGDPVTLIRSMTEYEDLLGDRTGGTAAYDAADVYFREGGARAYIAKTNGVGTRRSSRKDSDDAEASPAVVDAGIAGALALLNKDYGPGQILIADATLAAATDNQQTLLDHAEANNRVALLSTADSATAATLAAVGTALQASDQGRYGALFAPSAIVPGVSIGTTRTVPYTAVVAGQVARNDLTHSAAQPAAGQLGQAIYAIDLANRYTDAEYTDLNEAGVNMARMMYGGVRTYGWRTSSDPAGPGAEWLMLGWARLNMALVAQAEVVGERFVFSVVDGRYRTIAAFGSALTAVLLPYFNDGSLYGETPEEAFFVDVGSSVNTPETIAAGELHAVLSVRMSPDAEWVKIEIVKVSTLQSLAPPAVVAA